MAVTIKELDKVSNADAEALQSARAREAEPLRFVHFLCVRFGVAVGAGVGFGDFRRH